MKFHEATWRRWLAGCLATLGLLCFAAVAQAQAVPQRTATSQRNMVASVHPLATQAGVKALENGGNAVDAAIATALTLGVVDGFNSGIGGGCFVLIRTPDGEFLAIDGREMAPAAAHPDLFKEASRTQANPSRTGPLASGVPGALAAYHQAVSTHGRLAFKDLIGPAADLAERGFEIPAGYAANIRSVAKDLARFEGSRMVFFKPAKDGSKSQPYQAGDRFKQPDLANTYRQIAEHGTEWFYEGRFAQTTAKWMREHGGIMTTEDFANYHTVVRKPVRSRYRDYQVVGFPPPSSGGVHVAQVLNMLETFDLRQLHESDPTDFYHVIGESMKFAFADRAYWLGDPDYVDVPRGLISQEYARGLAARIEMNQAVTTEHGDPPDSDKDFFERHTTHIAAADAEGYWVAITATVNTTFGSKVIVPGLGVVMNNEMDDFVAIPDQPNAFGLVGGRRNAVEAGKRPLSSMSPTIVLLNDQPILTVGAAGGPKIITQVINAIVHHLDLGVPLDEAIARPRIHHQWSPKQLMLEKGFPAKIQSELKQRGHEIRIITAAGICQGISWNPGRQQFQGVSDPRTAGAASGQTP